MKNLQTLFDQNLLFRVGIFLAAAIVVAAVVFVFREKGEFFSPLG